MALGRDPFGFAGQTIESQFRVDAAIGEGGFSIVYRGHHTGLNEPVAIKCLKMPPGLGPELTEALVDRFRAESRLSYRLSQGNLDIVRSISSGTATAPLTGLLVPYTVLEWLEGHSLAAEFKVRRNAGMHGRSLDEAIALFEPAARALEYAHKQAVVHRDVKPGNLFLAETREGIRLKVLDFGLAKVLDDGLGLLPTAQTLARTVLASPSYGAPEQFDSKLGPIGTWTDVYSFALVLLEALADKKARPTESVAEGARIALDPQKLPTAHALGIKVPPKVEVLLARAVSLDRTMRPKSLGELWGDLKQLALRQGRRSSGNMPAVGDADTAPTIVQPDVATVVRGDEVRDVTAAPISPTAETIVPLTRRKEEPAPFGGTFMMPDRPVSPGQADTRLALRSPAAGAPAEPERAGPTTAPMPAVGRTNASPAAASVVLAPGIAAEYPHAPPSVDPTRVAGGVPDGPPPVAAPPPGLSPTGPGTVILPVMPPRFAPTTPAPQAAPLYGAPMEPIAAGPPSTEVRAKKALLALLLTIVLFAVVGLAGYFLYACIRRH